MSIPRWDRYPLIAHSPDARSWLTIQANLGLSQNTIEAYGRAPPRATRRSVSLVSQFIFSWQKVHSVLAPFAS